MEYPCLKTFVGYSHFLTLQIQLFPDMPKDQPTGRLSKGHEGLSWRIGWLDPHV